MKLLRDETGLIGKIAIVWLLVLVLLGVGAIDAASIAFTTYKLSDVGSAAASEGALTFKRTQDVRHACERVPQVVTKEDPAVRLTQDGCNVERHQSRVYNLCLRVLGDPDEAADASQDAFVAAIRKLHTFRGEAAFTTWLHRVTVNTCYDSLRRKRRRPLLHVLDDEGEERPDPAPPVPDHAERVGLSIDVERALRTVPDEFRVVLVM